MSEGAAFAAFLVAWSDCTADLQTRAVILAVTRDLVRVAQSGVVSGSEQMEAVVAGAMWSACKTRIDEAEEEIRRAQARAQKATALANETRALVSTLLSKLSSID